MAIIKAKIGGNVRNLGDLKLKTRFALLIAVPLLGLVGYGAMSFATLSKIKVSGPVYQHIVQSKDLIADILPPPEFIIESYLVVLQLSYSREAEEQGGLIERLGVLKGEYDTRHEFWLKAGLESDIGDLLQRR